MVATTSSMPSPSLLQMSPSPSPNKMKLLPHAAPHSPSPEVLVDVDVPLLHKALDKYKEDQLMVAGDLLFEKLSKDQLIALEMGLVCGSGDGGKKYDAKMVQELLHQYHLMKVCKSTLDRIDEAREKGGKTAASTTANEEDTTTEVPPADATAEQDGDNNDLKDLPMRILNTKDVESPAAKWETLRDYDGIRTTMRTDEVYEQHDAASNNPIAQTRIYSVAVEGKCDIEFFPLLSLLNEADLYPLWIPTYGRGTSCILGMGLIRVDLLERVNRTNFKIRILIKLPFPFSWRRLTFRIRGFDCMTDSDRVKQVLVGLESAEHEEEGEAGLSKLHPDYKGSKHAIVDRSAIVINPDGEHATYAKILVNLIPLLKIVPQWLINLAFRNLAFLIVQKIRGAKQMTASPVFKDRQSDPNNEFYCFIKKRMRESIANQYCPDDVDGESVELAYQADPKTLEKLRALIASVRVTAAGKKEAGGEQELKPLPAVKIGGKTFDQEQWAKGYQKTERRVTILNVRVGMKVRPGLDWSEEKYPKDKHDMGVEFGKVVDFDLQKKTVSVEWVTAEGWVFSAAKNVCEGYRMGSDGGCSGGNFDLAKWFKGEENVY